MANGCGHCPGSHSGAGPCHATATATPRSWLLIEHPGPWGERVEDTPAAAPIIDTVRNALRMGIRPQFIRRTGRRRRTSPLQVYAGHSHGPDVWMRGRELADPAELADLELTDLNLFEGDPVDGLFLVCTHGRRNACCARTGGPLARGLRDRFGDRVWETTHVGGDRYAANLVCFPYGLYYGDLDLPRAVVAVEAALEGRVVLDRFRGRAGLPEPAQAAEHYVRAHTQSLDIAAVSVESMTGSPAFCIVVVASGMRFRVTVEQSESAHPCGSECNENVRSYLLRDLTLLNEAALV